MTDPTIRLCAPTFNAQDRARVAQVLDSGMLVQGAQVAAFENALAQVLGVEVIACSSGTAALHLALLALDLSPGDEVIMPAFTWPSAAHAIVQSGATPVFVDIHRETLNLDAGQLEAAYTDRTRAVLPIHQFGIPAPMDAVMAFANAHDLPVVEDAACAIGTLCGTRLAGTIGAMGCFSFHPRKVLTTGEGGAITTSDTALAQKLRLLRNHGQDPTGGLERFVAAGLNYRLPEMAAAIGIGQVAQLNEILNARRSLARRLIRGLQDVPGVHVPAGVRERGNNVQSFVIRLDASLDRDAFMAQCLERGVQTTIGTYAVVAQPIFASYDLDLAQFPNAIEAMHRLVTLPLHPGMNVSDVDRVIDTVRHVAGMA